MDDLSAAPDPKESQPKKNLPRIEARQRFRSLIRSFRDAFAPAKLQALRLTRQPLETDGVWTRDSAFGPSQLAALAVHAALIALLLIPLYQVVTSPPATLTKLSGELSGISPFTWRLPAGDNHAHGGGGGGDNNPIPPSAGKLPPFALLQITPPSVTVRNPNPDLAAPPDLVGNPDLKILSPDLPNFGDPREKALTDSNGPGTGSGIGTHRGTGTGDGDGPGYGNGYDGGAGGGPVNAGSNGYGSPTCIYCPDPKYSEAARQVKFMGTVMVQLIVNADGRPSDIVVIKDPGMGLGEKAVEAVKTWQFNPARGPNGKPAATRVNIEVQFRLL